MKFTHTAKFGEQYAVTRFVGVTREDIVWWKLCSRTSEINTELQSPPSCLLCQLYVHSNSNYCRCTSANRIPFCFLQYASDKEMGETANDVPKNNVSTKNAILIKILILLIFFISQYHCNLSEDIQQSCLTVTINGM